ncbi:unnamed protein product [Prunus armeniaca]
MAQHLYKVIQSLANLVQQYFRLDGTPGSFYEYTRQVKVSSEILHKGSVGPQGIEVHEVGTVGIEELRVHFTPYLWPVSSAENKKGQSYWEKHACLKPGQYGRAAILFKYIRRTRSLHSQGTELSLAVTASSSGFGTEIPNPPRRPPSYYLAA